MICKNCGADVEDGVRFCPACGAKTEAGQQPAAPEAPAPAPEIPSPEIRPEKPARKGGWIGWAIGGVVLVALIVLGVIFGPKLFGKKDADEGTTRAIRQEDYETDEDYYRAVETQEMEIAGEKLGEALTAYESARSNTPAAAAEQQAAEGTLKLTIDQSALPESFRSELESAIGVDVSWFESVGLRMKGAVRSEKADELLVGITYTLLLNDTDLLDMNMLLDYANLMMYMSVPDLSKSAAKLDLQEYMDMDPEDFRAAMETGTAVQAALPDAETVSRLITRYGTIILNNITDVTTDNETVKAGGIENEYIVVTVRLDGDDLINLARDLCTEVRGDEDVKKIYFDVAKAAGVGDEEIQEGWQELIDELDETLEDINSTEPEDITDVFVLRSYVDEVGAVHGRELTYTEDDETLLRFKWIGTADGKKTGLDAELWVSDYLADDEIEVSVVGAGEKDEKTFKGEYVVSAAVGGEKHELATVTVKSSGENFNGEINIAPSKELQDEILDELDLTGEEEEFFRSLSLSLINESTDKEADLRVVVKAGSKALLTLSVDGRSIDDYDLSIPTDALDVSEWSGTLDYSGVITIINRLKDAGVPSALLRSLGVA